MLLEAQPSTVGHQRLRDHLGGRLRGQLSDGLALRADAAGSSLSPADKASVPIETAPGEECQFDWSDCCDFGELFGLGELTASGRSCRGRAGGVVVRPLDRPEPHLGRSLRFYEAVGGVPVLLPDRPDGRTRQLPGPALRAPPRRCWISPACTGPRSWSARPRRQAQGKDRAPVPGSEGELLRRARAISAVVDIAEINARAEAFLETRVHARPHSTTGVRPAERLGWRRR